MVLLTYPLGVFEDLMCVSARAMTGGYTNHTRSGRCVEEVLMLTDVVGQIPPFLDSAFIVVEVSVP